MMAPVDLVALVGEYGSWLVYLAIGFCFGFILESSGFGDARKLAFCRLCRYGRQLHLDSALSSAGIQARMDT